MPKAFLWGLPVTAMLLLAGPLAAQTVEEVHFAKGNYGTHLSGRISGHAYHDYRLGAQEGQSMFVELAVSATDGHGIVYFNILPPGSDNVALYNGSMDGNATTVTLPASGDYTIRVYLMGNDRDAGKSVGYELDLSIQ